MGVLVVKAGKIVNKLIFSGSVKDAQPQLDAMLAKDPTLTFQLFPDEKDPVFASAVQDTSTVVPDFQAQLDAIWTDGPIGGLVMEAMRTKILALRQTKG
jgi:hypothetical protein